MNTKRIGQRLREAIGDGKIRKFHRDLEALGEERGEKISGGSYAMLHRYLKGEAVPSLEFLEVAAELLGVRLVWLVSGEPPRTEAEAAASKLPERLWGEAAARLMVRSEQPSVVGHAFYGAVSRLIGAVEKEPELEETTRLAGLLADLIVDTGKRVHHTAPLGTRQFQDFYMAMLHALTLMMPMWRSVDSIETIIAKLEDSDG